MHTDKIKEFLESVQHQIRWKKAHTVVLEEIQNHITDLKNALMNEGLDENKAIDKAIREMGDPVVVGEKLNLIHKPKPDWGTLLLISSILLSGVAIQYYLFRTNNPGSDALAVLSMFRGQILGIFMGIPIMIAAYFLDFTFIGKYSKTIFFMIYFISIFFLLRKNLINGAIKETIYPLLLFPTAFAGFVYSMRDKGYIGIFVCGLGFLLPAGIAFISPSMSTLLLLCISCLVILTSAVIKGWFRIKKSSGLLLIFLPTIFTFAFSFYYFMIFSYRGERLKAFFLNTQSTSGPNWLTTQIRLYLSHAKALGIGSPTGQETEIMSKILPAVHTDFILTYIIYNLGWIVFAGIILIFSALILRGFILSRKQKSVLGYLTSLSIVTTLTIQCILYVSANMGFMIFSPLSFPLLSYGGKYLVVNMFLLGLLLSVFRTGEYVRDKKEEPGKAFPFIQYDKGTIHINLKNKTTE